MAGILKIGVPVALQDGFIQIAFIVITVIANKRGLNDAAAVGIVEKMIGILFLVPSSMLSTVSALSAQNIGAGKHERARLTLRYASILSVVWGTAAVIVMQLAYFASKFCADTLFPMGLASPAGSTLSVIICVNVFFWMSRQRKHAECFV